MSPESRAEVVAEARRFASNVLVPGPRPGPDTVYDDRHPCWQAFVDAKLANWWLPTRYGGRNVSLVDSVAVVAELAYADPGFTFTAFLSILGSRMVELFAPRELADRYLSAIAATGGFCATLGSEANAGSELANTETTFRRSGGVVVLNGRKQFSTNLATAQFGLVLARDADRPLEFAVILVPTGTPGFHVGPRWPMSGLLGTGTYPAEFTDCAVSETHVLRGGGIRLLEIGLNASRILMSAIAVGIVRRARDLSMEYAQDKRVGGRPLTQNAVFAARMGQWEAWLETIKAVCRAAAAEYDGLYGSDDPAVAFYRRGVLKSAVVSKMHAGQIGWQIVSSASEGFGGLGFTEPHEAQRLLRDMRHISIVEAGDDVLRELVFNRFVKRPSRRG